MNTIFDDIKNAWNRPNNALMQLIVINIIIFVTINVIWVFSKIAGNTIVYDLLREGLYIPAPIERFIFRPWTLFTYFFTHEDFFHLLFNMLALYWFGLLIEQYLGNSKLVGLYVLGGIAGGVAYLLAYNLIPYFIRITPEIGMIGASAGVYAVVVGAATLLPEFRLHLLFFGPVKIKYIAAVYIFLSFIGSVGSNAGGNLAHLGGALLGFVFIKQYQKGNDWSKPISSLLNFIGRIFKPKPKIRMSYRNTAEPNKRPQQTAATGGKKQPSQDEIDAILDKISAHGYETLTTEEKQILFRASQKK